MSALIQANSTVLFQGDSITDAGRDRDDYGSLGSGYAMIAAGWFSALYPELNVRFLNRGIGGDRSADMKARWEADCLKLKPDWVSIMIGINDTWRRFDSGQATSTEAYEENYRAVLEAARSSLSPRFILCEPFVLPFPEDRKGWREDLDPKIEVVHRLAREYQALLVPLDTIFTQALSRQEAAYWTRDGVHPTPAGHALIAQAWLRAVEAIS
ncbi:MAG TPA: SGNH/GDSL hydrolase family protein [Chloroflexia bacterium]|nr:SGNH/GDSL hydrolase family protein [Chloroflexia bacterium]